MEPPEKQEQIRPAHKEDDAAEKIIFGTITENKLDGATKSGAANVKIVRRKINRRRNVCIDKMKKFNFPIVPK